MRYAGSSLRLNFNQQVGSWGWTNVKVSTCCYAIWKEFSFNFAFLSSSETDLTQGDCFSKFGQLKLPASDTGRCQTIQAGVLRSVKPASPPPGAGCRQQLGSLLDRWYGPHRS